jgi:hypothetical protein
MIGEKSNNCDIFENFTKQDYKKSRQLMINLVLSTDMSRHFSELGKFKARIASPEFDLTI